MATDDRFKQSVVATLSKRAANRCSNPNCGAITSGPTVDPNGSVNVGEAAHIYGANPGSARYDHQMNSVDRSAITNAIWLCSNCHKLVDDDPVLYPAGLLFEWQREHQHRVSEQIGKVAADIRKRFEDRHLEEFGQLSYLAERVILEKGDYWEYQLTAEVLRCEISPVMQRWNALKRGLYVLPTVRIARNDSFVWLSDQMHEIGRIVEAFGTITSPEFARSWGAPGIPGSDVDIVTTCRLYGEVCRSTLAWEESVRFARVDEAFSEVRGLLVGVAGGLIEQAERVPKFLTETIAGEPKSGRYELVITVSLPDGWASAVSAAMKRARREMRI